MKINSTLHIQLKSPLRTNNVDMLIKEKRNNHMALCCIFFNKFGFVLVSIKVNGKNQWARGAFILDMKGNMVLAMLY